MPAIISAFPSAEALVMRPLLLLGLCAAAALAQSRPQLVYTARVAEEDRSSFHFSLTVHRPPRQTLHFVLPYWAPGAYRPITVGVRSGEPAWKQIEDVRAEDGSGRPMRVERLGPRRFAVEPGVARTVTLRYRNARPSSRRNNRSYLIPSAGLIDGPRSWMYLDGFKGEPAHVHFDLPEGWKIATALTPTFDPKVFCASDYDHLVDCPTLVGHFFSWTFGHRGVPHRVCVECGDELSFNAEAFVDVVRRIVEVYVAMWGDIPYEHYTFLFVAGGGGGLEHCGSTTIGIRPFLLRRDPAASKGVTAHEFHHTWNVKRLRPRALGPFDYTGPVVVNDLWICEGLTSYFTNLGLWRAGLLTEREFWERYRAAISRFERNRASARRSPQESSRSIWEGQSHGRVSYYRQGELLGLLLDLLIRDGSDNAHGLEDVMRVMYARHGGFYRDRRARPGYESEDWPLVILEVTGVDVLPSSPTTSNARCPSPGTATSASPGSSSSSVRKRPRSGAPSPSSAMGGSSLLPAPPSRPPVCARATGSSAGSTGPRLARFARRPCRVSAPTRRFLASSNAAGRRSP